MSLIFAIAPALPLGKAGKYVAAAYIVLFVMILIYVSIMATRAQRIERDLDELQRDVEAVRAAREQQQAEAEAGAESESDRTGSVV